MWSMPGSRSSRRASSDPQWPETPVITTRRPSGGIDLTLSLRLRFAFACWRRLLLDLRKPALEALEAPRQLGSGVLPASGQLGARGLSAPGQLPPCLLALATQVAPGLAAAAGELVDQLPGALAGGRGRPCGRLKGALDRVAEGIADPAIAGLFAALAQGWKA